MGKLVNIPAVLDTIGCKVTREQKEVIRKDLMGALKAFIDRETGSFNESEKLPFISVNRRTNVLAIHSRLLIALQLAVKKSVKALDIKMGSEAFDEVRTNLKEKSEKCQFLSFQGLQIRFVAGKASTARTLSRCEGWTGSATT